MGNVYVYILVMGAVTYLIRMLPLTLIQRETKNKFFKSFLTYVPYATLALMTFPAIVEATQSEISGIAALVTGVVLAFIGANLVQVAGACCVVVFISELIISHI